MSASKDNETPISDSTGSNALPDDGRREDRASAGNGGRPTAEERRERIATLAYSRAQSRGFDTGMAMEDWLEAERQVDDEIAARLSRVTSEDADESPDSSQVR